MIKGDRDIPVNPSFVPPPGCPKRVESIEQCGGPTNNTVCLEFCVKGKNISSVIAGGEDGEFHMSDQQKEIIDKETSVPGMGARDEEWLRKVLESDGLIVVDIPDNNI